MKILKQIGKWMLRGFAFGLGFALGGLLTQLGAISLLMAAMRR